jgi:hydroxyacylglutathione hydrolase
LPQTGARHHALDRGGGVFPRRVRYSDRAVTSPPAPDRETLWLRQLPLGPMKNFVYLLGAPGGREAAVVDPAWDPAAILEAAAHAGRSLTAIFLSHHHADHMNAVKPLLQQLDLPVYVQRAEAEFAGLARELGGALKPVGPGEVVDLGGAPVTCIHTPGHTPGSQCLLCAGRLLSGDTVFVDACGRCDLPGGDPAQMYDSLHRVLGALDGSTVVLPGHDYGEVPVSSLERERAHNPYFAFSAPEPFVAHRMRPRR